MAPDAEADANSTGLSGLWEKFKRLAKNLKKQVLAVFYALQVREARAPATSYPSGIPVDLLTRCRTPGPHGTHVPWQR